MNSLIGFRIRIDNLIPDHLVVMLDRAGVFVGVFDLSAEKLIPVEVQELAISRRLYESLKKRMEERNR